MPILKSRLSSKIARRYLISSYTLHVVSSPSRVLISMFDFSCADFHFLDLRVASHNLTTSDTTSCQHYSTVFLWHGVAGTSLEDVRPGKPMPRALSLASTETLPRRHCWKKGHFAQGLLLSQVAYSVSYSHRHRYLRRKCRLLQRMEAPLH